MRLRGFWLAMTAPSQFENDPYGGLKNQWGHYTLGAAVTILLCLGWHAWQGEMPYRYLTAGIVTLFYVGVVELLTQGWRGRDTLEDSGFTAAGAFTVAGTAQEIQSYGRIGIYTIDHGYLAACIVTAAWACIVYAYMRWAK